MKSRINNGHSTTKTTAAPLTRKKSKFPHQLPENRLGTLHATLEDFRAATCDFKPSKIKEYSLVLVTELSSSSRKILLGLKHRGFGKGFRNSFGGKVDPGETIIECAMRELQEETGIVVTSSRRQLLQTTATLHFTFEDSD
eukprot:CAMPEP_0194256834 /NCGR_PEP_ID=MMETSP0158-20130606/37617_1 /TAXON_ID=33649 /ORGANISM="Thalassionema nitzschioides, Strain L26-B" /LENGTH=140 /DNA_ID=CAMNT_0038995661 /DNA_START=86 /DNA_END=505 /DNA_ORIENTATION=+